MDGSDRRVTRRALLAGGLSAWGAAALGQPTGDLRPRARPGARPPATVPADPAPPPARAELAQLVERAGLGGGVSIALVDVESGTVLAAHDAGTALPPASVAKALTALYAMDALGPERRFATRLLAAGPVVDGRVEGDLILAGGGDPVLDTDRLAELARALREAGVTGARGLKAWGGALPAIPEVDPDQAAHLGYNPAVSGLNLNFNRVHFEWARGAGGDYAVVLDARGEAFRPEVQVARVTVAAREAPVYAYAREGEVDAWSVAGGSLGEGGARWLPVRSPALYAGQAFRGLVPEMGLPPPAEVAALPSGAREVARIESEPLERLARDMLLYSTNLTAEVLGLHASLARGLAPGSLAESAAAMNGWVRRETGARVRVVDHSGLGGASRVAAGEMALALAARGTMERLRPLLRDIELTNTAGEPLARPPALVRAKTGTLNFASALAGYARTLGGRDLAFAILAADPERRAAAGPDAEETPPGGPGWTARARRLQQELLQRWGTL